MTDPKTPATQDFLAALHTALDTPPKQTADAKVIARVWSGWPAVEAQLPPHLRDPMRRVVAEALAGRGATQ